MNLLMTGTPYTVYSDKIEKYARDLYSNYERQDLVYHNLAHTEGVIKRITEILTHYPLNETDKFILFCAGWFHDTGHLFVPAYRHEQKSADLMKEFLSDLNVNEDIISFIAQCILVTKFPGNPQSLPEKIICDADLFHLGTEEFIITDNLVKEEFELRNNFVPVDWNEMTLMFLQSHHFHTDYCQNLLSEGKTRNINYVMCLIGKK